jgi:hypothetical protein
MGSWEEGNIIIFMSIIRYVITSILYLILVSMADFGKYSEMITEMLITNQLFTPLPLNELSETEEIYQDQGHYEGAGDGNYGQDDFG